MVRRVMAVVALFAVCGVGLAQEKKADDEEAKRRAEQRAAYFKAHPTELPDLLPKLADEKASLPGAKEEKTDTPAVRAGKRAINAEAKRYQLIHTRIQAGSFSGAAQYNQISDCVFGQYAAATLVWDDPEKLLPYAEAAVVALMAMEEFNAPRAEKGVEEPQLLPQLQAARHKAEVMVLKLREKAKKK